MARDTTSGSLNLLTPSSTGSRVPDFTKGIQERASTATTQIQEAETPKPDTTSQRSSRSQKKPSYLHLACSINGYNNLTKYDSKLRKDLNKSREASPIRPITFRYSLVVPVPVSADKLIVRDLPTDERCKNLTYNTPDRALTDHYHTTTPVLAYMAAENKQLKKDFLSSTMDNVKDKDQVDHAINSVFKSSYSETNIIGNKYISKKRVETVVNGVSKRIEITKENGEDNLSSPIKSFIQQRVERLYGPGALAQGFFNQKRLKNINPNDCISDNDYINNDLYTKVSSESLPVLRHLRPEFRAQLPIISPKKNVSKTPPKVQIIKVEIEKNGHDDEALLVEGMKKNGVCEKDGHFFLDLKKRETDRLLALSARAESELEQLLQQDDIDEEVYGFIRSAAGKARLLATQKMQQFEGLCYNNINRRSDDMFPTTCEDLEGFWDMVMLQVHHVDALFKEMDEMRSRGWVVKPPEKTRKSLPSRPSSGNRKPDAQPIRKSDGNNAVNEKSRAAAEKRDRERKAMMEHRRKLIKEKQMLSATTNGQVNSDSIKDKQDVEIFVGKQNGKSNGTTS